MSSRILPKGSLVRTLDWGNSDPAPESPEPPAAEVVHAASAPNIAEIELARLKESFPRELQAAYKSGQKAAEEQFQSRYESVILKLTRTIDEISQARARHRREAENDMVRLSLAVARRILHREITLDPKALQGVIKAALDTLERREISAIRVHPSLLPDLQRAHDEVGPSQPWNWTPDSTLDIGAVIVDTTRGQLDASIKSQLEEIERGFADHLPALT